MWAQFYDLASRQIGSRYLSEAVALTSLLTGTFDYVLSCQSIFVSYSYLSLLYPSLTLHFLQSPPWKRGCLVTSFPFLQPRQISIKKGNQENQNYYDFHGNVRHETGRIHVSLPSMLHVLASILRNNAGRK